jgi:transcription termination factor Rho
MAGPALLKSAGVTIGRIRHPVTDTSEQTLFAASTPPTQVDREPGSDAGHETSTPTGGAARPAKGRGGSLSSMLLPELQELASSLGIPTTRVRKSDLVAAIQNAQDGRAAGGGTQPTVMAAEPTSRADVTSAPPAQRRERRGASRPTSSPAATEAPAPDEAPAVVSVVAASDAAPESGEARSEQPNRQGDSRGQAGQGGQSNQANQGNQGGQQSQGNQGNQGGQNRQNDRDDDFDGSRRRGRRYRDRRGRTRDRVGGSGGGAGGGSEAEPTVAEDDVLTPVAGILDSVEDKNTWFIRTGGYFAGSDDVYVANSFVRRFGLRRGDAVTGVIRQPRDGERREKFNPLVRLDTVNGRDPDEAKNRIEFNKLTPLYPQERLRLETEPHILTTRVIDLVMPIGKGQRALIVSPPKAGKTMVLQAIANAISTNNPECHLMVVLVDERPEEVTDMQRSVKGEVIASTFDRRPQDHTMVAELATERAKRLVEMGHDVVVLLDSITRLGRAYNLAAPASGRILSGGVDSTALYPPKRFLGAARNIENGGSLTILATALVETGSAGDTVIYEEFKGTGNAELRLKREIADKRVFPAIDVDPSGTRKEELLLSPDELAVTVKLRRVLHALEAQQAIDLLLDRLKKTRTNIEFLMQIAKTTPGAE